MSVRVGSRSERGGRDEGNGWGSAAEDWGACWCGSGDDGNRNRNSEGTMMG